MTEISKPIAIVLAAGKGSRITAPHTKSLLPIAGKAMIDHVIQQISECSWECVVVVRKNQNTLNEHIKKNWPAVKLAYQAKPNGTGDAFLSSQQSIEELNKNNNEQNSLNKNRFAFVLFADSPLVTAAKLNKCYETFKDLSRQEQHAEKLLGLISYFEKSDPNEYGRISWNNKTIPTSQNQGNLNLVDEIIESKGHPNPHELSTSCNGGIMGLYVTETLKLLKLEQQQQHNTQELYLTKIIKLAKNQQLRFVGMRFPEQELMGVNNLQELEIAETIMQKRLVKYWQKKGVLFEQSSSVHLNHDTQLGANVIIKPNVYFDSKVEISNNVTIHSFSHISHSKVEHSSSIGPFAKLRAGCFIGNNNHIGSFVEVKNTSTNQNTKISHLNYVGDSKIGSNNNIGAGTIFCNYDGKNKHQTQIGDNCFIGANNSLIAPLSIGDNCKTGASTVVSENLEHNQNALSRPTLKIKNKK